MWCSLLSFIPSSWMHWPPVCHNRSLMGKHQQLEAVFNTNWKATVRSPTTANEEQFGSAPWEGPAGGGSWIRTTDISCELWFLSAIEREGQQYGDRFGWWGPEYVLGPSQQLHQPTNLWCEVKGKDPQCWWVKGVWGELSSSQPMLWFCAKAGRQ